MNTQPVVNDETCGKKGILKMKENEQESTALYDTNNQSVPSGGPVCARVPRRIEQSPDAEEVAQKLYTERRGKNSGDFKMKFKPFFFRRGCSEHCTGYNKELDTSSPEITVCTSKKNKLRYRIKRSKRKLQQFSHHVKKRTKKSVKRIKKMYKNMGAKRAAGFDCDLKKCPSTLTDCSATSCTKPNMLFSKIHKLRDKITRDKEEACDALCFSTTRAEGTDHEFKVLKDQSVGTSVDRETST